AWIQKPELFGIPSSEMAVRLSFLSVAIWWIGFSIPLFRGVPEPPRQLEIGERPDIGIVRAGFSRLAETLRELRGYKQAFLLLVAFVIYNDGIGTIQAMAAVYGTGI